MQQNYFDDYDSLNQSGEGNASAAKAKTKTLGRIVEHCFADLKKRPIHVRNFDKRLKRTNVDPGLAVMIHFMRAIQRRIMPVTN